MAEFDDDFCPACKAKGQDVALARCCTAQRLASKWSVYVNPECVDHFVLALKEASDAAEKDRDALAAQVKRWEDKEVARAVDCCGQQERADKAEGALRAFPVYEIGQLRHLYANAAAGHYDPHLLSQSIERLERWNDAARAVLGSEVTP